MLNGAAGGLIVALVIVALVAREASSAPGRVLAPSTLPLLVVAATVLAARAATVLR